MFDKMFEQSQKAFQPASELMTLTSKAFEEAAEKQKTFFTDVMNENLAFFKELGAQKDFSGVYQAQKTYMQKMQDKMMAASTDAYEFVNTKQEKAGEVIKSAATS